MTLERCFDERKLRKDRPDLLKAERSVVVAESKLKRAEELSDAGFQDAALLTAYAAMFHAGRALLFKDGIIEKSHYCLSAYLKETYGKSGKIKQEVLTIMDAFREERHDALYSLEGITVQQDGAKTAIENAKMLLEAVKRILSD